MSQNSFFAKFLRFIGIVMLTLTAGFTVLGGIGTGCAAFSPLNPKWADTMGPLVQLQWLYIFYVLIGVVIGVYGFRTVFRLIKGNPKAYREALIVLFCGLVIGGIHISTSRMLRGKSMPVDAVVYSTVVTLIIFLLFQIPGIREGADFSHGKGKDNQQAGGTAAIVLGLFILTIQHVVGATHTWGGINYADTFNAIMVIAGISSILLGSAIIAKACHCQKRKGSFLIPKILGNLDFSVGDHNNH